MQAAEALEHAHQYGVVHRDIKPGNLMVDVHGQLWITDFGLAQFQSDAGLTLTGDLLGTLRYMSPEQALAKRGLVDHRTDIYSLGATLFELLTLEPAYTGRDREELLRQLAFEEPRPPRRVNPEVPHDLETIILKAMAKSVEDRYASARELGDDLRRFLEYKPIKARRPTLLERGRKWVRRHQALVGTAVVVAVAALAVSTVLVRAAYVRERQKAKEAEESFRLARETVDFFTQLIEDELADAPPPLQGLRQKALEASLAYYQGFIEQRSDDASVQAELALSQERVSKFLGELTTMQGFGQIRLLDRPDVRDELQLTPEQRDELRRLTRGFQDQWPGLFRGGPRALGPGQRRELPARAAAHQKEVRALLKPDQARRLKEIEIQDRGPMVFHQPDVIKALALTPAQEAEIKDLQQKSFGRHCDPPGTKGPHPDEWQGPEQSRGNLQQQILSKLTDGQRARWEKLIGPPFAGAGRGGPHGPLGFERRGGFRPKDSFPE